MKINPDELAVARTVLAHYGLDDALLEPVTSGLINRTFTVATGEGIQWILQRVNPIFPPSVHEDIDAVTRHLADKNLLTPHLVASVDNKLSVRAQGRVWRLLTYIVGSCYNTLASKEQAHSAGALLARFHAALADLKHEFKNPRAGVHDTARHLRVLAETLAGKRDHPRFQNVAPLAREILELADHLPPLPSVNDRIVHGDPKISNVVFTSDGSQALCLIDLDTLTNMPLPLELGDAFRSWCNPEGEDTRDAEFSLPLFEAAIQGYASSNAALTDEEWRSIVPATQVILIELAARFCADALNERYFGWDPDHYGTRGEHNEVRAAGQIAVAHSLDAQQVQAVAIVERAFGAS